MQENQVLEIKMLGEFSLKYGDKVILDQNSRSRKVWAILEYLVAFREKEISQNELIELLWPEDGEVSDPSNTLKTLLHRVRAQLNQLDDVALNKTVCYRRGAYRWVPTVPCHVDVEEFETLCKRASAEQDDELRLKLMVQAIDLYKGDFLPRSALEGWVAPINTYYRGQYTKIVHEALEMLVTRGQYDQALSVSQRATAIDPYDESFHLYMIKSLLATGAQRAALNHYYHVTELFFTEFGISPSEELTALYKTVVKSDRSMEMDLNIIKQGLQEDEPDHRAICCEYEFFKEIYRLSARSAARTGQVVQVALLSVSPDDDRVLTQKQLNGAMDRLKDVLSASLRRNDVFSRYSVSQYLVMLSSASYENGCMVLNRVVSAYRRKYPKANISLPYKVLPLDPILD